MFDLVNRRHFRRIALLLIAAQVLLSAPVGSALASLATSDSAHCAGMMPAGDHSESCPCCPDGETGMAACLSACMASAGAISSFVLPRTPATIVPAAPLPIVHRADLADPPLNPPPID